MRLCILFFLSCFSLFCQNSTVITPDCIIGYHAFTTTGRFPTAGYPNLNGCIYWTLSYQSTGFSGLSIELDSAPDASGVAGTWVLFTGTLQNSTVNPATNTTGGYIQIVSNSAGGAPWVSINVTSVTGNGTITAVAYGYRRNAFSGGGGGGGGGAGNIASGAFSSGDSAGSCSLVLTTTTFTASGCTNSSLVGSVTGSATATHGWACDVHDLTSPQNVWAESATGTTSFTLLSPGITTSGDTVNFGCVSY